MPLFPKVIAITVTIKESAFIRSYSKLHSETFTLPLYGGNKMHEAQDWKLLANCQHLKAGIDHYIRFKLWVKYYATQLQYSKH